MARRLKVAPASAGDFRRRPRGIVRILVIKDGRVIRAIEEKNLFVNAGLPALAALLGGDYAGEFASAIGFGSGAAAPTTADTHLTAPAYYKALDSHAEDGLGSVTFNWSLSAALDAGAVGITITELGLFANSTSVALPGTVTPVPLLARRVIAPIGFSVGMNISGQWVLTF